MAKVLLIEDDPLVVRMYQKILAFEGFEIESAPDGRSGIEKAKTMKPDLIFCDVMMPKLNGIEVLEHLKADANTKDIPVIMLTNLSGTHDAETALEKGAFAYMVKSEFKPKDVAQKAKEFFSHAKGASASQQVAPQAQPAPASTQPAPVASSAPVQAPVKPIAQAPAKPDQGTKPPGK
jgi:CheY-like chemotaxis protein